MISENDKSFLRDKFNIDCDNLSEEELNKKLDSVLLLLEKEINESKGRINNILEEIRKESYEQ